MQSGRNAGLGVLKSWAAGLGLAVSLVACTSLGGHSRSGGGQTPAAPGSQPAAQEQPAPPAPPAQAAPNAPAAPPAPSAQPEPSTQTSPPAQGTPGTQPSQPAHPAQPAGPQSSAHAPGKTSPAKPKTPAAAGSNAKSPPAAKSGGTESKSQPPSPESASSPPPARPSAAPALDLNSLEQRLRDTHAIGVFTKLSLKNQVDDLLAAFRAFHNKQAGKTLSQLRQQYDVLLLKVLSLLQDDDPSLAAAISSSREAIWGILTDPQKFSKI